MCGIKPLLLDSLSWHDLGGRALDGEHAKAAQQIKVAGPVAVIEIRSFATAEPDIIAHHLEHPNELLVAMTAVELVTIAIVTREQRGHVQTTAVI
jgi:hypothetical protein